MKQRVFTAALQSSAISVLTVKRTHARKITVLVGFLSGVEFMFSSTSGKMTEEANELQDMVNFDTGVVGGPHREVHCMRMGPFLHKNRDFLRIERTKRYYICGTPLTR